MNIKNSLQDRLKSVKKLFVILLLAAYFSPTVVFAQLPPTVLLSHFLETGFHSAADEKNPAITSAAIVFLPAKALKGKEGFMKAIQGIIKQGDKIVFRQWMET